MEQQIHDEIDTALRIAERKPHLIEAMLEERRQLDAKLAALGYVAPKKTRNPRTPAAVGSEPKRRRKKTEA
jgi:hypothetical protein